jgi:hypothetical protein
MLEKDPDFYLKVLGMNQRSKRALKIAVTGQTVTLYLDGKCVGSMLAPEFYAMSANEIWSMIGVSNDNLKQVKH